MMSGFGMQVSLFGKHPSSSEYLHLGQNSDFTSSIINWIENGYEVLLKIRQAYATHRVLNFYFLNKDTDSFVCGTLQLSKDSKGREYPIVILVQMQGIEQHRDCQALWNKNLDIFKNAKSLDELIDTLSRYKIIFDEKTSQEIDTKVLAAFMSEDFSKLKLFYQPLQIDDFIEMMR